MPVTPFGRLLDAAQMARLRQADAPRQTVSHIRGAGAEAISKWDMLRELTTARRVFGLTDRDLSVLQALLSFHPGAELSGGPGEMIIHPSNASICDRLNGMPDSTMRRHLSALVSAGILLRRDSPNGKRYCRRSRAGSVSFGFDLWPLVARRDEILTAATTERALAEELHSLRETVSLMRRDLVTLMIWGESEHPALPLWTRLGDLATLTGRDLRRKPVLADLERLQAVLELALEEVKQVLAIQEAEVMSSNSARNEQHIQNSDKEIIESEEGCEESDPPGESPGEPTLPLRLVLSACEEVQSYAGEKITSWRELVGICETVRPMMGISADVWQEAKRRLGAEQASVVIAAMLQRVSQIRSPGGYLRHLVRKAGSGGFSPGPMIMALARQAA